MRYVTNENDNKKGKAKYHPVIALIARKPPQLVISKARVTNPTNHFITFFINNNETKRNANIIFMYSSSS